MKKLISIIALSLASFVSSAAMVSFPNSIEVLGVNGQSKDKLQQLQLTDGKHLIELRYYDNLEVNADDTGALVKSEPLYLYLDIEDAVNYMANTPAIYTEEEARAFINNPIIELNDGKGGKKQVALMTHQQLMAKLLMSQH